jgi:UDP-N-acetylglucosamine 2-epimerase (non-hydrolysing)
LSYRQKIRIFAIKKEESMKRICIVAGARPNFVKVSPLMRAISKTEHDCKLVYAGREDDPTLEDSLFEDLQMACPDYYLGVDSQRLNEITSRVMAEFDNLLNKYAADVVIVVDDLASTMAAAIVTKKRGIALAHLVAGTRSFDINMPKEINRLVIDALSDYLFTAGARSNSVALREQADAANNTYMVGNILMDTLRFNYDRLQRPAIMDELKLKEGEYIVLTLNRKALLADRDTLKQLLEKLLEAGVDIVAPLRGDTSKVVNELCHSDKLHIVDALPYLDFGWTAAHARAIVTDSGNVAEEATFNHVPCMTLNDYTEHMETVTVGTNELIGGDAERLGEALAKLKRGEWKQGELPERWDGRTADRIVQILTK